MPEIQYFRPSEIRCWSCKRWMKNDEFWHADGHCLYCDAEIDEADEPYTRAGEPS